MEKVKKYLVTGATGHIGVALLHELKAQNKFVRVMVVPGENYAYIKGLYDELVFADVTSKSSLFMAFKDIDSVFHLAGIITIGAEDKKLLKSVNIEGTKNVLEAAKNAKVKRLVYTSSVHAINVLKKGAKMTEQKSYSPKKLTGEYAKSKATATQLVMDANGEYLETIVTFPSGVIGPYAYKRSNIGQLIMDYKNKKIPMFFKGAYNYVDVRDVAHGLARAEEVGRAGEGYILSGHAMGVEDMLKILETETGIKRPKSKIPVKLLQIVMPLAELYYKVRNLKPVFTRYSLYTLNVNCDFSSEKAQKELGFNPRPLEESFKDEIKFMLGEKPKNKEEFEPTSKTTINAAKPHKSAINENTHTNEK
ncbi:MAG: NAD-dependent epimerase/dehydratase family protein [Spirochaetales bacterium]